MITIPKDNRSTARSTNIVPTNLSAGTFSYLPSMVHFNTSPSRGKAKLARYPTITAQNVLLNFGL